MNAIIIEHPFGEMVVNGEKKFENRKTRPPKDMIGVPLLVVSEGYALGEIIITDYKFNQSRHEFFWHFAVIRKYPDKKKIITGQEGEWIRNAEIK